MTDKMRVDMIDAAMVEMANIYPPLTRNECARLIDAAWQAAKSMPDAGKACQIPVVGEPVEWQYRWLNPDEYKDQPASLLEWQRVIPYPSQSNEKRLEELLAYRSHGKACYEIRALIVQPTTSISAAELEQLRKEYEQKQALLLEAHCERVISLRERIRQLEAERYGMALVPRKLLGKFPELNTNNYSHDDVDELNSWGIELLLASVPRRCHLCNYQHGHQIGCENNQVDITMLAAAKQPKKEPRHE